MVGGHPKQLGAEAYYYVMINEPMTCLTLNRLHKSLTVMISDKYIVMDDRKSSMSKLNSVNMCNNYRISRISRYFSRCEK